MTIYFQPTGSNAEPTSFDYSRLIRHDLGPEIITTKSPSRGTFWILEDATPEPADHPLYDVTSTIDFTSDPNPTHPHFRRAIRTWVRTRKPQVEIDALLDAREEDKELELLRRAVTRLVRGDDVVLTVLLALVPASTLGAGAKSQATTALNNRKAANDQLLTAIDALNAETVALKAASAGGADVEVTP